MNDEMYKCILCVSLEEYKKECSEGAGFHIEMTQRNILEGLSDEMRDFTNLMLRRVKNG